MHASPVTTPVECNARESTMSKQQKSVTTAAGTGPRAVKRKASAAKPKTKLGQLEAMLRRPDGATVEQLSKSLDWQAHSVRGAISGALKKKQGLTIASEKAADGRRVYRIAA
jgi:Protein of unknown function (DUF3489)